MCVWSSRRVPGVKYMHVLDLQTRNLFFSFYRQHTSLDDYGPRKEAERVY